MSNLLRAVLPLTTFLLGASLCFCMQSQHEMNVSAHRELKAAESEMQQILAGLSKSAESKPKSVEKLKRAQAAWQAFRDAHINAYWPSEEPGDYGSSHPVCLARELTRLTNARISELRQMTRRIEGDVCACQWPD